VLVLSAGAAITLAAVLLAVLCVPDSRAKAVKPEEQPNTVVLPASAAATADVPARRVNLERVSETAVSAIAPSAAAVPNAPVVPQPPPAPAGPEIAAPQESPPLPASPAAARAKGVYGTCVDFVSNPAQAAERAMQQQKLLFRVHISGNFEDAHFT
jgi:hypothetical protein